MGGKTSLFRVGDAVELWRVLLHLSVLVACLLLFERALHHLEGRAAVSAKYQQLLSKAYRELMILGLIGLGLKLIKEAPSVDSGSAAMTAFQVADLTIFILALALILQTVCIFLLLRKHNVRADRAELLSTEDLADAVASPSVNQTQDMQELIHFRLLRHLFLNRFQLPQLFPFAKYLRQAQNNQITHMTDVDGITLSEVVNHFREIVELRSEFAVLLWESMQARKLSIGDLQAELKAHDPSRSGAVGMENLRVVLRVCGLRLSSYRFNSVARLLFELKDMRIEYNQLIMLVTLAQSEALVDCTGTSETMVVHHHPLLLQSALSEEEEQGHAIIRENSYLPPRPLLGAPMNTTPTVLSDDFTGARTEAVHSTPLPTRPQLKRSDSKFQGMSSSTLRDLFHIESALHVALGAATPAVDGSFGHV
ncbi:hypothetical protein PRNP1_005188 [Phytophthora ramorum]